MSNVEIKVTNLFGDETHIIGTIEFKTVTPENEPAYISLVWYNGVTSSPENAENKPTSVKIADYKLGKDFRDNDILIVTYEFYNGENKEKGFAYTFTDNAYQHGVELDDTVVGCDEVNAQTQFSAIKPGVTHNVVVGYHITDRSDVTIQLTEWIGDKIVLNETLKIDDL